MEETTKDEIVRQAMSIIGSKKTEKKSAASRANVARAREALAGQPVSEEQRQKQSQSQTERRARERAEREAASPPAPKRPRGRPKKVVEAAEVAENS